METTSITQAVILAGGRGERLRPLTDTLPKPMAPVCGRPFLEYLVALLKENGIEEIILLVGYLHDAVTSHFGDGSKFGIRIRYSIGSAEDDTGARIRNARDLLDDAFLLIYGDNYWPMDVRAMADYYREKGAPALMTVYTNYSGLGEYGRENNIRVLPDGYVGLYDRSRKDPSLNAIDIGSFILRKHIVDEMPDGNFSFEQVILPKLIAARKMAAFRTDCRYYSITDLEKLKRMEYYFRPGPAVFLDRDGVINKKLPDGSYVTKWEEFEFLPGAVEGLAALARKGYELYIVSNQQGIGRGLMSEKDLAAIHANMKEELARHGVLIRDIRFCPHLKEADCFCRKPKPGMIIDAAAIHHVRLRDAIMIGDSDSDMRAGKAAGCRTMQVVAGRSLLDISGMI